MLEPSEKHCRGTVNISIILATLLNRARLSVRVPCMRLYRTGIFKAPHVPQNAPHMSTICPLLSRASAATPRTPNTIPMAIDITT